MSLDRQLYNRIKRRFETKGCEEDWALSYSRNRYAYWTAHNQRLEIVYYRTVVAIIDVHVCGCEIRVGFGGWHDKITTAVVNSMHSLFNAEARVVRFATRRLVRWSKRRERYNDLYLIKNIEGCETVNNETMASCLIGPVSDSAALCPRVRCHPDDGVLPDACFPYIKPVVAAPLRQCQ